ncbi:GrpB family protein [Nocardiopsis ganjiahuensis]|uniref:GrpB family protein n=1 Tax=Nocardiopsis ganjiahuensis TaxID=239984 RepID=UPI00036FEAE3|nr:GrpB family protein [Nocardiopsis ganjiahuensis]
MHTIPVHDHDPRWVEWFAELRDRLAPPLAGLPVTVEHVGSTSVPGCAAKPIIDVDVVMADASPLPEVIRRLVALGYRHEGDLGIVGRDAFEAPTGHPEHHLYAVVEGSRPHLDHVLLRNWLRTHPEDVHRYSQLKRKLGARFAPDDEGHRSYLRAKSSLVEELLGQAYTGAGLVRGPGGTLASGEIRAP